MTDRELLERAAEAAGIEGRYDERWKAIMRPNGNASEGGGPAYSAWNPLTDDGDALRLSVKVAIDVVHARPQNGPHYVAAIDWDGNETLLECAGDPDAATRRAIVCAAVRAAAPDAASKGKRE